MTEKKEPYRLYINIGDLFLGNRELKPMMQKTGEDPDVLKFELE